MDTIETADTLADLLFRCCSDGLERVYLYALLLDYRSTASCVQLLSAIGRYLSSNNCRTGTTSAATEILCQWMEWFPEDFCHEESLLEVQSLCSQFMGLLQDSLSRELTSIRAYSDALSRHESWLFEAQMASVAAADRVHRRRQLKVRFNSVASSLKAAASSYPNVTMHAHCQDSNLCSYLDCQPSSTVNAKTMAYQLTRIELAHLSHLDSSQILDHMRLQRSAYHGSTISHGDSVSSSTRSSVSSTASSIHSSSTDDQSALIKPTVDKVDAYITWFNRLTYLTATTVCQCRRKRCRVATIEFWTEVGRHCINLGNFNSLTAIMSGLSLCPVARLRRTWDRINRASGGKFTVLEHQIDPRSNFTSYRSTYRAALSRSETATNDEQRIAIPFFSLVLKDIVMAKERTSTSLTQSLRAIISGCGSVDGAVQADLDLVRKCQSFDTVRLSVRKSPFPTDCQTEHWLFNHELMSDEELDFYSYVAEDPSSDFDKDRFRVLKSHMRSRSQSSS